MASTTSKGGKSKSLRSGFPSGVSSSGVAAIDGAEMEEEEQVKERESDKGAVDLRVMSRQKEKEEDQRGQGWDFGKCLGALGKR